MYQTISDLFNHKGIKWIRKTQLWNLARMVYFSPESIPALVNLFQKKITNKKTIFIMTHSLGDCGAERVASVLASELTSRYHVVLICARREKKYKYPLSPEVKIMYIPGLLDETGRYIRPLSGYMNVLKQSQNVYASISMLYQMNLLNVESRAGDKVICSERNNPTKGNDSKRFERIQDIYEKADYVIFQSEVIKNLFNEDVQGHSSILPNPVGISCLRKNETKHRIINVGRLRTLQKSYTKCL